MAEQRTCSHCGMTFEARLLFAVKLGRKRLERCPHCRKLTDVNAAPPTQVEERRDTAISEDESLRRRIEESKVERQ